jgi:hypothetical protein
VRFAKPEWWQQVEDMAARHREFAHELASRQSLMIPAEDPDFEDLGPAFPAWPSPTEPRSSSRQSPRSRQQDGYWNTSPAAMWTWKPLTNGL